MTGHRWWSRAGAVRAWLAKLDWLEPGLLDVFPRRRRNPRPRRIVHVDADGNVVPPPQP